MLRGLEDLQRALYMDSQEGRELESLISSEELFALNKRVEAIIELGRHPMLDEYRNVPWPPF